MPRSMYGRASRAIKKSVKARYYNKAKGSVRFNRIAKDVYNLKQAINSEKKHHLVEPSSTTFAQYTGTASGHELIELSPAIPQGTGSNQRVGNQVKLTGACMELLLTKQPNQHGTIGYKIVLLRVPNGNDTLAINDFLESNHFLSGTIYDTASQRNQQQMSNIKVVKTIYGRFQQDQNTDTGGAETNIHRNLTIPLKFTRDNMIRYPTGASVQPIKNRYYLVCLASNGDTNTSTAIQIQQYTRWYYVDN